MTVPCKYDSLFCLVPQFSYSYTNTTLPLGMQPPSPTANRVWSPLLFFFKIILAFYGPCNFSIICQEFYSEQWTLISTQEHSLKSQQFNTGKLCSGTDSNTGRFCSLSGAHGLQIHSSSGWEQGEGISARLSPPETHTPPSGHHPLARTGHMAPIWLQGRQKCKDPHGYFWSINAVYQIQFLKNSWAFRIFYVGNSSIYK